MASKNIFRLIKAIEINLFLFLVCCTITMLTYSNSWARENTFTNHIGMKFIKVDSGSFMMGSPESEPFRETDETLHKVNILKPFYLQTTEVTVKQWRSVMGKKLFGRKKGKANSPVTRVSFFDCLKFINKINKMDKGTYIDKQCKCPYS